MGNFPLYRLIDGRGQTWIHQFAFMLCDIESLAGSAWWVICETVRLFEIFEKIMYQKQVDDTEYFE